MYDWKRLGLGIVTAIFAACGGGAQAAEFHGGGDTALNCKMTVRGPIEPGDADAFLDALRRHVLPESGTYDDLSVIMDNRHRRICLDSPGGSLNEAIRMVDILLGRHGTADEKRHLDRIGTVIPAGARCLSACAVLFMAGGANHENVGGRTPDRILHARGQLGFHAPALRVPDGQYSRDSVDKAFRTAILSMNSISERQEDISFPPTLLARMIATPPDQMFHVTRLGEAAQWMIDIAGLPRIEPMTKGNFLNACLAAQPGLLPTVRYWENWIDGHDRRHNKEAGAGRLGDHAEFVRQQRRRWQPGRLSEQTHSSDNLVTYSFRSETELEESSLQCRAEFYGELAGAPFSSGERRYWVEFERGSEMAFEHAFLYPPQLAFSGLAQRLEGQASVPADAVVFETGLQAQSRCLVFDRFGRQTDSDPCQAEVTHMLRADGQARYQTVFTWPSGARTFLSNDFRGDTLNGKPFSAVWDHPGDLDSDSYQCLKSQESGNTFCFERSRFD